MSNFSKLLEELDALTKAMPLDGEDKGEEGDGDGVSPNSDIDSEQDDERIQAAAGEGDGDADGGEDAGDGDEDMLGKAMEVTLDNGEKVQALDGTELVKSLIQQTKAQEQELIEAATALTQTVNMVKSFQQVITKQDALIKSLQESVETIGKQGRGRRTVISIHDKPDGEGADLNKAMGMTVDQFLTKSLDAMKEGKITGTDVSRIESYLNRGMQVPEALIKKVAG